jgi:hypothetical protein
MLERGREDGVGPVSDVDGSKIGFDQPVIGSWLGILRMQKHTKDVSILRLLTGRRNSASLCEHDINVFASSDLRV